MKTKKLLVGVAIAVTLAGLFTIVTPFRAAAVQVLAIVTCASALPCTGGNNTSTGPGVQGTSTQGKGVVGQTKFSSTTTANGQNGVLGQDISNTGFHNTGVTGISAHGTGVKGISTSSSGIFGQSSTGVGVFGGSTGVGVYGQGKEGVEGSDRGVSSDDALFANGVGGRLIRANNVSAQDVFVLENSGVATFTNTVSASTVFGGTSTSFFGVSGTARSIGANGQVAATCFSPCAGVEGSNNPTASSIAVRANGFGGFLFVGNGNSGHDVFTVDDGGNVHAHSFTSDLSATQATSNGSHLTTYSLESRAPTIEDFGEATLVAGQAYVRLDNNFAAGIDRSRPYLVFITPLGAVGGTLYVTQRTSSGFAVRADAGARPNVAFDYRIVARPYAKSTAPYSISHGTKPMPFMRSSVTIPRAYPQSKPRIH